MRVIEFTVPEHIESVSVKGFLRGTCGLSHRLLTKLKQIEGGLTVDGKQVRTIDKLKGGDIIAIAIPDDEKTAQPVPLPLEIVYEDSDVLVLNKPAGMPVHPSRGHQVDTLSNAVAAHLAKRGEALAFRPINRLDRDTTGLVVVGLNTYSASRLHGAVDKVYYAVCQGVPSPLEGTIDAPIRVKEGHGIQREIGEGGERSVTHYRVLRVAENLSFMRIVLETGRTHQIRVHFSCNGMPLAGDDMYGGSRQLIDRQALHCGEVSFVHPTSGENMHFSADIPPDMHKLPPICIGDE